MKRLLDISISILLLAILSIPLLILAGLIRICLGAPILFCQIRPGLDEQPFVMYKFRTMTDVRGPDGELLPDNLRLNSFGRWLRSTSLDELPELWNVLKGDMSLVGPRPLLMEYLPLYNDDQRLRHKVRPGITGWAQVNGRNAISWEEKFKLDIWYVNNITFFFDIEILLLTVKKVLLREGVGALDNPTVSKFRGSPSKGIK